MQLRTVFAGLCVAAFGASAQAGVINDWNDGTVQGWTWPSIPVGASFSNVDNKLSVDFNGGYQQDLRRGINATAFEDFKLGDHLTVEVVLPSAPTSQFQISWFLQGQYYEASDINHTTPISFSSGITGMTALTTAGFHLVTWNFNNSAAIAALPDDAVLAWGELRLVTNGVGGWDPAPITFDNLTVHVPEPASLALVGLGGLAVLARRRA